MHTKTIKTSLIITIFVRLIFTVCCIPRRVLWIDRRLTAVLGYREQYIIQISLCTYSTNVRSIVILYINSAHVGSQSTIIELKVSV